MLFLNANWQAYVPWDIERLYSAIGMVRDSAGVAFNVGIMAFAFLLGIRVVVNLVSWLSSW